MVEIMKSNTMQHDETDMLSDKLIKGNDKNDVPRLNTTESRTSISQSQNEAITDTEDLKRGKRQKSKTID